MMEPMIRFARIRLVMLKKMCIRDRNPIVNVRMANYKISVMGEVAHPGTFTITNEKVNICLLYTSESLHNLREAPFPEHPSAVPETSNPCIALHDLSIPDSRKSCLLYTSRCV